MRYQNQFVVKPKSSKIVHFEGRSLWRAAKQNPEQIEPSIFLNGGEVHTLKDNKDWHLLFIVKLHYLALS